MKRKSLKRLRAKQIVLLLAAIVFVVFLYSIGLSGSNDVISSIGPTSIRRVGLDPEHLRWMDNSTRYNYNFRTVVEPRVKSCPTKIYVIVSSAPHNVHRRRAIRRTWAQDIVSQNDSRLIFSLGMSTDTGLATDLKYEQDIHDDVVVFDFMDSYNNATLKTVLSVKFAAKCRPAYFLKTDDDTYVNVDRLLRSIQLIEETLKEPFIAGQVHYRATPHRTFSKWSVSREEYPESSFPPYVSGNLYVISGSLLPSMIATALHTRHVHLEDVFMTGLVATKLMIPRVALEGIRDQQRSTTHNCAYDNFISGHYIDVPLMEKIHSERRVFVRTCTSLFFFSWCSCVPRVTEIFLV